MRRPALKPPHPPGRAVAALMDGKVDFVCCDFPTANRLTLHILAAVAEHEREMISARTKAGLAAAKASGKRLGNPKNLPQASAIGVASLKRNADTFADRVRPMIADVQYSGAKTLRAIGDALQARGVLTARGGKEWSAAAVRNVLIRLGERQP